MFCCRAGMNISLCWLQRICTTLRNSSRRNRRRMWVKMKSLTHLMANRYLATSSRAPPHSYGAVFCHPFDVLLLFCPRPDRGAEYCDEHVCLSVCLSLCLWAYLQNYTSDRHQILFLCFQALVHVTYGHGLVLLWQHCYKLCTSGFMDDILFAHL